jgi:DnaD/phage-associated family protein
MASFKGFPSGKVRLTPLPGPFFTKLLPAIDHLGELKVTLYSFWLLDHREARFRYLQRVDFQADKDLMRSLDTDAQAADAALDEALKRARRRGTLLSIQVEAGPQPTELFFLNSPRGRAAIEAIQQGAWSPGEDPQQPILIREDAPNIFRLYEDHIGPLTPMIAEALQDAENAYPAAWIEEAVRIAIENNVRRWRYIEAILRTWHEEGRDERRTREDTEKDRHRYVRGKFSDFIEH